MVGFGVPKANNIAQKKAVCRNLTHRLLKSPLLNLYEVRAVDSADRTYKIIGQVGRRFNDITADIASEASYFRFLRG